MSASETPEKFTVEMSTNVTLKYLPLKYPPLKCSLIKCQLMKCSLVKSPPLKYPPLKFPDELLLLALGDKILKMCIIMLNFRN